MRLTTLSLLSAALLSSCTVHPLIKSGDTVVSLGGSIFKKNTAESASYSGPLGTLTYNETGKDETVIPGKIVNYYGIKATTDAMTSMYRTRESTTRILAKEETSRAATKSAAETANLKILNPVEEIPLVTPAP